MAKISTPKTSVKIADPDNNRDPEEGHVNSGPVSNEGTPSEHIISNILNFSKALNVKRTKKGMVIANVMN